MMDTYNSLYQTLIFNDKYKLNYCKMQFLKKSQIKKLNIHYTYPKTYIYYKPHSAYPTSS